MKKILILTFLFFFLLMLVGCDKQEMTYVSRPVGFSLVSDTYVAKGSFVYYSNEPYNVNQVTLELYYLPAVWGEIEIGEQQIAEDDLNFIITDYDTENQKVFAKYIHVGESTWTAEIDNSQVKYVNQDGDDILEVLAVESEAKAYVEALEAQNAYFLDHEMVMLNGYTSKLAVESAAAVSQQVLVTSMLNISWTETLTAFPDLSGYFSDYNSEEINALFDRVFSKAEEAEFRTSVFYGKG